MDLRSIINSSDAPASKTATTSAATAHANPPRPPSPARNLHAPSGSVQAHIKPPHGKPPDLIVHPGQYASPPPPLHGTLSGRPTPPMHPSHLPDVRSPSAPSYAAPYNTAPNASPAAPPSYHNYSQSAVNAQAPPSPSPALQYPSRYASHVPQSTAQSQARTPQYPPGYPQLSAAPQTPPITASGAPPYPDIRHRSQSSVSSTPTSTPGPLPAYGPDRDSPDLARGSSTHQRQLSQPRTPLLASAAHRTASGSYLPSASPYPPRNVLAAIPTQSSPVPLPPAQLPARLPSNAHTFQAYRRPSTAETPHTPGLEARRAESIETPIPVAQAQPAPVLPSEILVQSDVGTDSSTVMRSISPNTKEDLMRSISAVKGENHVRAVPSSKRKLEDRENMSSDPYHEGPEPKRVNGVAKTRPPPPAMPPRRKRYTSPPIWARSVKDPSVKWRKSSDQSHAANPVHAPPPTNGHANASPPREREAGAARTALFGPWEESIIGKKPYDDLTKITADWLFLKVVNRDDLGELALHQVVMEVEAKLGQIIDTSTNQRYRLPVRTECILDVRPGDLQFKSSMTEIQHQHLNKFLNEKVVETHPANPEAAGRVAVEHKHRREIDRFFALPESQLPNIPSAVRILMNPRHTPKVRVTLDQKTNEVLAKIVKVPVENLHIHMPRCKLDCRLSLNLEMHYPGRIEDLGPAGEDADMPDRGKDRLSYTQGQYQIDLTQVTKIMVVKNASNTTKEHELEVELNTNTLQEHGRRARSGQPNDYIKLVEGFVDNVRVLAREASLAPDR